MTTHETLRNICDMIWYEIPKYIWDYNWELVRNQDYWDWWVAIIDVREIIFTQEFMNKYMKYLKVEKNFWNPTIIIYWLFENLQDPVWYLYNLI